MIVIEREALDAVTVKVGGRDVPFQELAVLLREGKIVEVVRCKDCRHRGSNAICVKLWVGTKDSFFCAFGERRDAADDRD